MNSSVAQRSQTGYCGRFAPTPSGPLHLGSLLTAVASFVDARKAGGRWLLRIDDLDQPRCVPGADSIILQQLESHGLFWDGVVRYQTAYRADYEAALKSLLDRDAIYGCDCTRANLAIRSLAGIDGPIYDGYCRNRRLAPGDHALRFTNGSGHLYLHDRIQGAQQRNRLRDIGDFVLRRRDGIIGYHLACVIDEHAQGITDVVRGADLIAATFCQLSLMQTLVWPAPRYAHVPVLTGSDGAKLSKQNHAPAIDSRRAGRNLWQCLQWLGQSPPPTLADAAPAELLRWATAHWTLATIAAGRNIRVEHPP